MGNRDPKPLFGRVSCKTGQEADTTRVFPRNRGVGTARLGIDRWVAGDYEDFLIAADKDEDFLKQNVALMGYRSFRANYRVGYWEVILAHTRPLGVVPKDMRVS